MTSFKAGSGDLFENDEENEEGGEGEAETEVEVERQPDAGTGEPRGADGRDRTTGAAQTESGDSPSTPTTLPEQSESQGDTQSSGSSPTYPYAVRRNNVGDERDTRLEIHVRDKVVDREGRFRQALAEELGASEVAKTDAREYALLAAFENPEAVAEMMREEGFGTLD